MRQFIERKNLSGLEQLALLTLLLSFLAQLCASVFLKVVDGDSLSHLHLLNDFGGLLRSGELVPRWLPSFFHGFGGPAFYFYPPFVYYVGGVLQCVFGLTPLSAFHILGVGATIVSAYAMFALLRTKSYSQVACFMGALVYAAAPYRFLDLHIRGALGEHVAFAILPFFWIALDRLLEVNQDRTARKSIVWLAICWGLLLVTNIPSAAIAGVAVVTYLILRLPTVGYAKALPIIAALVLGSGLVAYYLAPILHFYSLINSTALWQANASTGSPIVDLFTRSYLSLDATCVIMLFAAIFLLPRFVIPSEESKTDRSRIRAIKGLLLLTLLLQLPYISPRLFATIPPFTLIQIPFRCDVLLLFCAAILIARFWREERVLMPGLVCLWSIFALGLLTITAFQIQVHPHPHTADIGPMEYLPKSAASKLTLDALAQHEADPIIIFEDTAARLTKVDTSGSALTYHIVVPKQTVATFHHFWWPQFRLTSNQRDLPISADSFGRIVTNLPSGAYDLRLYLVRSGAEILGEIISLVSIGILIGIWIFYRRRYRAVTPQ
jgi:hypothetical protein